MQPGEPGDRSPEPGVTPPPQPPEVTPPPNDGWAPPASATGQPSTSGRRPKTIVIGAIGLVAALAVAIGMKVAPFLAAGVLGSALAGAFGGPWDRLPSDVQAGFEQRLEAAVGDRLKSVDEAQRPAQIESLVRSGMQRLSDDRLVRRLILQTKALGAGDGSVCAAFGRQALAGSAVDATTATALFSALPTEDVVEWIEIGVEAIEAEAREAPDPIFASEAEASALIDSIFASLPESQVQTMADVNQGLEATDAEVCAAILGLYDAANNLGPDSLAVMARIDVQPQP